MLNSKGQAFSVFELMIAAVVAIAILAVLMSIIGNGGINVNSNPTESIATAIGSAAPTGEANAQQFSLEGNDLISGTDLANEADLDPRSIVLFEGELEERFECDTEDSTATGEPYSYCKYTRTTASSAKAKIYCSVTGNDLIDKLNLALDSDMEWDDKIIEDVCEEDTYQPCCAAIMIR
jgi:hypothetical protein